LGTLLASIGSTGGLAAASRRQSVRPADSRGRSPASRRRVPGRPRRHHRPMVNPGQATRRVRSSPAGAADAGGSALNWSAAATATASSAVPREFGGSRRLGESARSPSWRNCCAVTPGLADLRGPLTPGGTPAIPATLSRSPREGGRAVRGHGVAADPDRVWAVQTDIDRWPEWTGSVRRAQRLDPGHLAVGSTARIEQPRLRPTRWRVTELAPDATSPGSPQPGVLSAANTGYPAPRLGQADGPRRSARWPRLSAGLQGPDQHVRMEADRLKRRCESG
jgi:hypothetical protein